MPKRKRPPPERLALVAVIHSMERSYYIAEEHERRRVDDEAILTLIGTIQEISSRYKRHCGKQFELMLICARSFNRDHAVPAADKPFLMSVSLRGDLPSLGAYLPADAFWALPEMISSGAVTHVEVDFGPSHAGYADLLSLNFTTASKIEADRRRLLSR